MGSNPTASARERRVADWQMRRSYKADEAGSIPVSTTNNQTKTTQHQTVWRGRCLQNILDEFESRWCFLFNQLVVPALAEFCSIHVSGEALAAGIHGGDEPTTSAWSLTVFKGHRETTHCSNKTEQHAIQNNTAHWSSLEWTLPCQGRDRRFKSGMGR